MACVWVQVQMQMEADQHLAALQQQSQPPMQREWASVPVGSLRSVYGQHTNGSVHRHGSHDGVGMMSQDGSPMDDSPPNQSHVSGTVTSIYTDMHHLASVQLQCCITCQLNTEAPG